MTQLPGALGRRSGSLLVLTRRAEAYRAWSARILPSQLPGGPRPGPLVRVGGTGLACQDFEGAIRLNGRKYELCITMGSGSGEGPC